MNRAGYLRLSSLRVDGEVVAGRFGYEKDGVYYGVKSAFDPSWAR